MTNDNQFYRDPKDIFDIHPIARKYGNEVYESICNIFTKMALPMPTVEDLLHVEKEQKNGIYLSQIFDKWRHKDYVLELPRVGIYIEFTNKSLIANPLIQQPFISIPAGNSDVFINFMPSIPRMPSSDEGLNEEEQKQRKKDTNLVYGYIQDLYWQQGIRIRQERASEIGYIVDYKKKTAILMQSSKPKLEQPSNKRDLKGMIRNFLLCIPSPDRNRGAMEAQQKVFGPVSAQFKKSVFAENGINRTELEKAWEKCLELIDNGVLVASIQEGDYIERWNELRKNNNLPVFQIPTR